MIETSVKAFSSTNSGAPTLNNTAGSLIAVLDACLVNGFGLQVASSVVVASGVGTATFPSNMVCVPGNVMLFSGATGSYTALNGERKILVNCLANVVTFDASGLPDGTVTGTVSGKFAPAGWTKAFSGTNKAAYKSLNAQSSGMFFKVDDTGNTVATVRGYESLTAIDVGTGGFPTAAQVPTPAISKSNSSTAVNWAIFANDKAVYVWIAPTTGAYGNNYFTMMFGDIIPRKSGDPYRFAIFVQNTDGSAAGSNSSAYYYQPITYSAPTYGCRYLPRSYTALGSPVIVNPFYLNQGTSVQCGTSGSNFPNAVDNGILTTPMLLWEANGAGVRGEMPGIFATPQAINKSVSHGTIFENLAPLNKTLMWMTTIHDQGPNYGGLFVDIIGPWGN